MKREKPEPIWRAILNKCVVACYDFQLYKISDPPPIDAEPVIIDIVDAKRAPKV